jgi:spermidine synthase
VVEKEASRRLKLNNYYVLGGTSSAGDERIQAHVPLLLHASPRRVAMLGLGTGITAGGALFHPIESLTAVELVPDVVAAAGLHFREANAGVLQDARTRVVVEDARGYLRGTAERFDAIVGDLVVPWRHGESALFTQEHFAAARRALLPGGLFCQWLPLFQLSQPELQIVLRTFLSVFPRAQLWRGDFTADEPAVALVGGAEALDLSPARVQRRIQESRPAPLNPHLREPIGFWMHFVGVLEPADLPSGETRISREDSPWVELIGPLRHAGQAGSELLTGRRLHDQ